MLAYVLINIFVYLLVDSLRQDDWDAANVELLHLQEQGKVIYYQPFDPNNKDRLKRPFIVVIQDDFMRECAMKFSMGKSWAFDSTFKTNPYGLPLYAGIVPNQDGKGMPVFYMLCSTCKKQGHEGIAIEVTFNIVFASIGKIRPSAIIIDKHKTSFNSIQKVTSKDPYCWETKDNVQKQVAARILLCHFHALKAWSENLLSRVPDIERNKLWSMLHILMCCPSEEQFNYNVQKLYIDFKHMPNVIAYLEAGWTGVSVPWRSLWPKWGRLFNYGGMDTTNHIERHWEWIKYSLLQGKVNCSLRNLIVSIIGSASDGTKMGGPTLVDHFKQVQIISECTNCVCSV